MRLKGLTPFLLCILTFVYQHGALAAASATGEWSKEVNGVQGRLIVSEDPMVNGTRMFPIYLELRNVSDVINPIEIYYTGDSTKGTVVNKHGKEVPTGAYVTSTIDPTPFWITLPYDSLLRFRLSMTGYGVPKNGGALLGLNDGPWIIKPDSNAPYFLQATFAAVAKKDSGKYRQWQGTLNLPKVKIPMAIPK
jgi:hypothetical protein